MDFYHQGAINLSIPQYLYPIIHVFNQPLSDQCSGVHDTVWLKSAQGTYSYQCITLLEDIGEPAFWQPALQRHLSTFKSYRCYPAGACFLSFVPFTGGLSMT